MNFKSWLAESSKSDKLVDMAAKAKINLGDVPLDQLAAGIEVEREHDGKEGSDIDVVKSELDLLKIAMAHLREDPKYYTKLKKAKL